MIGLLLALAALAIVIAPDRAPIAVAVATASAAVPWREAWRGADGTALRPASSGLRSRSPCRSAPRSAR